ncbi:MAG: winged helix-turn-helix domain-containing protein [Wenzhouxiangella sp.]|nr:winged helix-turn-helix domain-containing protein [Wenzhouxiangella sp.]
MAKKLFISNAQVDVDANRIRVGGRWCQVKPRSMAVLIHLVDCAGDVCARRDIMDSVWGQIEVSDEVLNHAIHELRVAFEDDPRDPKVIETIPRGGYRLIASVQRSHGGPRASSDLKFGLLLVLVFLIAALFLWAVPVRDSGSETARLAVLPFKSMDPDVGFQYFSDGLTEELITRLNDINPERLDVIARTSVMIFKDQPASLSQIAEQLDVDYIVEGSVRRGAGRLRIKAQLIETQGQTHLWTGTFERPMGDVLDLQARLAREIATQAGVPLRALGEAVVESPPPAAFQHFLRGREHLYQFHPGAYKAAVESFDHALEIAPVYADAHGWRAMAQFGLAFSASTVSERRLHARAAAESAANALDIDPDLGIALAARAWLAFAIDWDFERAEALYRHALEADENSWWVHWGYSELLSALGRHSDAIHRIEVAHGLDPVNPLVAVERAAIHARAGDHGAAIRLTRKALDVMPYHQELHDRLPLYLAMAGRYSEAIDANTRFASIYDMKYDAGAHARELEKNGERGYWQWLLDSRRWMAGPVSEAKALVILGRMEQALDSLSRAVDMRVPSVAFIGSDQVFAELRGRPRFERLLERIGINE